MLWIKMKGERVSVAAFDGEVKRLMLEYRKFVVLDDKGRLIGQYIPMQRTPSVGLPGQQQDEPVTELDRLMREIAEANGMTLEELEDLLVGDLP